MKIVIVSAFYSEGMGYSENCLSRALAELGHDVHVVTSTYNVYSNEPLYDATYREFLGPGQTSPGTRTVDGYRVHRLKADLLGGYVRMKHLLPTIRAIGPDVVHSLEVASLQTWELAAGRPILGYRLFTETHQTLSVMRPYMLNGNGDWARRAAYRMTRTLPTMLASFAVEKCYAVTPDCAEVAIRFYGVPESKVTVMSLGADTQTFHPPETDAQRLGRDELRRELGYGPDDVVCVYTGRFTPEKNPLLLAQAIDRLRQTEPRYVGLFIGNGVQRDAILGCQGTRVVPFMTHRRLAEHYRAADLGVWPRQESMSMIDAASSGLPIIASNRIGEPARVRGNGKMYEENDAPALAEVIRSFGAPEERRRYGAEGRRKMLAGFSWTRFAQTLEGDFRQALDGAA